MKIKISIYLLLIMAMLYSLNYAQIKDRPKVGLVLSGGGAKGFAHIGVLEIIEKEGIPIDYIVGTSIGSIIGGLYSIGYNSDQLKDFASNQVWGDLLSDYLSREYRNVYEKNEIDRYLVSFNLSNESGISLPLGVVHGHNVMNTLCKLTAKYHDIEDFSELPIPFACVAADIVSGEEVVLKSGYLPEAIFASMSIPSIFAPTEINNKLLVDGGIINNYPVDVAKEMGADIIIGVDIQTKPLEKDEIQDLTDILGQIFSYMGYDKYRENKKQSDILIEPDISGYGTGSFSNSAADTLIKRGREATLLKINEIKTLLSKNKIPLKKEIRNYSYDEEFNINYFMVGGLKENSAYYTLEKTKYNFPNNYNFEIIDEGIKRLYGTNSFNKAYFRINGSDIKTLGLIVKEKNTNTMNAGFNFNSTDKASILVNFTFRNQLLKGSRLSLDAKLSTNTMFGASYQISASSLPELYLGGVFKNFNVSIYDKDKKVASSDVQYLDGELSIIDVFGSNYLINFGIQGEYYKIDPLFSEDNKISFTSNENTTLSLFGKIRFDNLDDKFYPTRGFDLYTKFSYSSNKADNIIKNTTTPILLYSFKTAIKMGSDVSFIPHFYGRLLLNENTDIFMRNAIGGTEAERLLDFNLPFIGIKRVVFTKDKTFIAKGELRIRINDNNYLSLIANGLSHFSKFSDWKTRELLGGLGINYSFKSLIGPIDVLASTSDYTKDFAFFINVGRWF